VTSETVGQGRRQRDLPRDVAADSSERDANEHAKGDEHNVARSKLIAFLDARQAHSA